MYSKDNLKISICLLELFLLKFIKDKDETSFSDISVRDYRPFGTSSGREVGSIGGGGGGGGGDQTILLSLHQPYVINFSHELRLTLR